MDAPASVGSYTTARVTCGRVERTERHASRLRRDASRLGLPLPDRDDVERLLFETARSRFGDGDGIIRIEWSRVGAAPPRLRAQPREIGADPAAWRAGFSSAVHPGPEARRNTKFVDVEAYDIARAETRESGLDEMLLLDADGWLVEGGRANLLVADASGTLATPAPELGAVEGLGLTILRERHPKIRPARLSRDDVEGARELLAVNAVRGVVPIVELCEQPIGGGRPGVWAQRLAHDFGHP